MVRTLVIASDSEDERPNRRTSNVSSAAQGGLSESALSKALESAQKENFALRSQMKELQLEINTALVGQSKTQPSKKSRKKSTNVPEAILEQDGEISKHGRKYSLMICPWIEVNIFEDLKGRPNIDPMTEERFTDNISMMKGTIAELYDFLPDKLHPIISHSYFVSTFRVGVRASRSNAVLAVRQRGGNIYSLDPKYFDSNYDRASVPELQKMLRFPGERGYPALAPVLFADFEYDHTMKNVFKNEILVSIARTILFGKSSSVKSKPQTVAEIWKVTKSTPGLIAFCAILARFMISPDSELRPVGPTTKINWLKDFNGYKKKLCGQSKKIKDIFRFFDEKVFGLANGTPSEPTEADIQEDFDDAMRALNFDDPEESDSEEETRAESTLSEANSTPPYIRSEINEPDPEEPETARRRNRVIHSRAASPVSRSEINEPDLEEPETARRRNRVIHSRAASPVSDDSFGFTESEKRELNEQNAVARLKYITLDDGASDEGSQERLLVTKVHKARSKVSQNVQKPKTARVETGSSQAVEDFSQALDFEVEEDDDDDPRDVPVAKTVVRRAPSTPVSEGELFVGIPQETQGIVSKSNRLVKKVVSSTPANTEDEDIADVAAHAVLGKGSLALRKTSKPVFDDAGAEVHEAGLQPSTVKVKKTSSKKAAPSISDSVEAEDLDVITSSSKKNSTRKTATSTTTDAGSESGGAGATSTRADNSENSDRSAGIARVKGSKPAASTVAVTGVRKSSRKQKDGVQ